MICQCDSVIQCYLTVDFFQVSVHCESVNVGVLETVDTHDQEYCGKVKVRSDVRISNMNLIIFTSVRLTFTWIKEFSTRREFLICQNRDAKVWLIICKFLKSLYPVLLFKLSLN